MSHFTVTVKVTKKRLDASGGEVERCVRELLAPFDENARIEFKDDDEYGMDEKTGRRGYWDNPNGFWDWYSIGGRWTGFYPVKPGVAVQLGRPGAFGNQAEPGRADIVRLRDIDMNAVTRERDQKAAEFFDNYQRLLGGEKFNPFDGPREMALSIGLVDVVRGPAAPCHDRKVFSWSRFGVTDERRDWSDVALIVDRPTFLSKYVDCFNPIATYAAVDNDGWHAPGKMGWFACSSETGKEKAAFCREFMSRFVTNSDPDDTLVLVDCHV